RRDELLEKVLLRSLRIDYDAGDVADAGGGIVALVVAELGNAPETVLAHRGQVHCRGERAQCGIGADVARGMLTPDVLLAGTESQDIAAARYCVDRRAHEAPDQAPDVLAPGGEDAQVRAAERRRQPEALAVGD